MIAYTRYATRLLGANGARSICIKRAFTSHHPPTTSPPDRPVYPTVPPAGSNSGTCPAALNEETPAGVAPGRPAHASVIDSAIPVGGGPGTPLGGKRTLSSGGAMNVVTMTMSVNALKIPTLSTPEVKPI